jgi:hypothetical protein
VDNRIIDLSLAAAKKLDMIRSGTAKLRYEVVAVEDMPVAVKERLEKERREADKKTGDVPVAKKKPGLLEKIGNVLGKKKGRAPEPKAEPQLDKPKRQPQPKTKEPVVVNQPQDPNPGEAETKPTPGGGQVDLPQRPRRKMPLTEATFEGINTYSIWGTIKYPEGFGVQVASFAVLEKVLEKGRQLNGSRVSRGVHSNWLGRRQADLPPAGGRGTYFGGHRATGRTQDQRPQWFC